ncbi:MAG: hypothetical protein FWE95_06795 [Planctomycetaceae bacterium]|nr:hypothetical protein [Planctomycetaceae bacterium]
MTKKRINSKKKGNRAELELAKILTKRFDVPFARVGVSSGARVKNTRLPDNAVEVMTGDLMVPQGFRFSIECKAVNVNVDFLGESVQFDKWLRQATDDAQSIGKLPMLCWKQNRKGWIVAVPARGAFKDCGSFPHYYIRYGHDTVQWKWGWIVCRLDVLLETNKEREFWFDKQD